MNLRYEVEFGRFRYDLRRVCDIDCEDQGGDVDTAKE